jgi:hypothetical protein
LRQIVGNAKDKGIVPDLSQINDMKHWSVINADCESALGVRPMHAPKAAPARTIRELAFKAMQ